MCWCTPTIRTPCCGKVQCVPPACKTLSLKTKKAKDSSAAIELAQRVGMRFVEKKDGRFKLQMQLVEIAGAEEGQTTWVDVPLCPETYGPVKL